MERLKEQLQKTRIPWRLLGWLLALNIMLSVWYILRPFRAISDEFSDYVYSVIITIYPLLIAILCFRNAPNPLNEKYKMSGLRRFSPILIGIGMTFILFGRIIQASVVALTHQLPHFTSAGFLIQWSAYPFLACAILFLPAKHISHLLRVRILLDSLSIIAAIITLSYYFVLAPLIFYSNGTSLEKMIAVLSPLPDLVLMFCLLSVALRSAEKVLHSILILLALTEILIFLRDLFQFKETIKNIYNPLSLVNLLFYFALAFAAVAAQTTSNLLKKEATGEIPITIEAEGGHKDIAYRASSWKAFLAPTLMLLFIGFVLSTWMGGTTHLSPGPVDIVDLGAFVVLILMVLRQFLMLYEIGTLQRKLQHTNRQLDHFNAQLKEQATTDPLTGLPNHRMLVDRLDEVLAKAQATRGVCSVIFMDIDHFKSINDNHGHAEGDKVLHRFGALVQACLRAEDCVGRWGGEEFVALLPDVETLEALYLAERIRKTVEEQLLAGNDELNVTCSLGIASYPHNAADCKRLLARADQAMYAAKRLGRNQVRAANEPEVLAMKMSI